MSTSVFYIVLSTGFLLAAVSIAAAAAVIVKNRRAQARSPVVTVEAKVTHIMEAPESSALFYSPGRSGASRYRAEFKLGDGNRKTFRIPKKRACPFDLGESVIITYQGYKLLEVRKKETASEETRAE